MCDNQETNTQTVMPKTKKNSTRFGLFYRSNGRWAGPYAGATFTAYTLGRKPISTDVHWLKNYVLKSRIKVLPVAS